MSPNPWDVQRPTNTELVRSLRSFEEMKSKMPSWKCQPKHVSYGLLSCQIRRVRIHSALPVLLASHRQGHAQHHFHQHWDITEHLFYLFLHLEIGVLIVPTSHSGNGMMNIQHLKQFLPHGKGSTNGSNYQGDLGLIHTLRIMVACPCEGGSFGGQSGRLSRLFQGDYATSQPVWEMTSPNLGSSSSAQLSTGP